MGMLCLHCNQLIHDSQPSSIDSLTPVGPFELSNFLVIFPQVNLLSLERKITALVDFSDPWLSVVYCQTWHFFNMGHNEDDFWVFWPGQDDIENYTCNKSKCYRHKHMEIGRKGSILQLEERIGDLIVKK